MMRRAAAGWGERRVTTDEDGTGRSEKEEKRDSVNVRSLAVQGEKRCLFFFSFFFFFPLCMRRHYGWLWEKTG